MGKRGGPPLCIGALVPHMVALDKIFFFFQFKSTDIFLFLHENIRCGYSLEAPH